MKTSLKLLFLTALCGSLQACDNFIHELPGWEESSGTGSISMQPEAIVEGIRPYKGTWGPIAGAYAEKIAVPGNNKKTVIHFVRVGYSTANCGDSEAIVSIPEGGETTPADMKRIFGTERPQNTFTLAACVTSDRDIPSFNLNISWKRPARTNRSSLVAAAAAPAANAAANTAGSKVGGRGLCKNTASGVPEIIDSVFTCDLEAKLTQFAGLGVLSQIVKTGELKANISWDVIQMIMSVENDKLRFPEIQAEFRAESTNGQVISGTMRLQPEVLFEGPDLCHATLKDVNLNFADLTSPQLSSFVTRTAAITLENNATINRALMQVIGSGFMTYVPDLLSCNSN